MIFKQYFFASSSSQIVSWSEEFLKLGGYAAMLTRLNEILEVEWRLANLIYFHFSP